MATSPNFSWPEPDNTDLVKNGALAIRTAINAIDTSMVDLKGGSTGQVLKKNSNTDMDFVWSSDSAGMTNPMTTTGDTIYSSSGSTPARLGIGSNGQVLTVSGGIPAWTTATSSNIDWVLVSNTTTNTGTSYTISGLGSYKKLRIFYSGVSNTNTNGARLRFRMNGDTGANYNAYVIDFNSQGSATLTNEARLNQTSLELCKQGTASAADTLSGYIFIDGCDGTGDKIGWQMGASNQASTQARGIMGGFRYDASAGISNITVFFDTDSFDAGTVSIYGSLN